MFRNNCGRAIYAIVAEQEVVLDHIPSFSKAFVLFFAFHYALDLEYVAQKAFKVIELHIAKMDASATIQQVVKKFEGKVRAAASKV